MNAAGANPICRQERFTEFCAQSWRQIFYKNVENVENVLVLDLDRDRKDSKAFPSLYKVEAMHSQIQWINKRRVSCLRNAWAERQCWNSFIMNLNTSKKYIGLNRILWALFSVHSNKTSSSLLISSATFFLVVGEHFPYRTDTIERSLKSSWFQQDTMYLTSPDLERRLT